MQERFDFRKDSKLLNQIEKAFNDGLEKGLSCEAEARFVRQHAYCLVFGITLSDIKKVYERSFNALVERSMERHMTH
jgi:hypothetical protein